MSKIVLDTNIIVRAVASPSGLASELLRRTISALKQNIYAASTKTSVQRRSSTIAKQSVWRLSQIQRSSQSTAIKSRNGTSGGDVLQGHIRSFVPSSVHRQATFGKIARGKKSESAAELGQKIENAQNTGDLSD